MAVASTYLYLTMQDLESRLSAEGVLARLGDNWIDTLQEQALTDVLSDASETLNFYTWMKYDPSVLVGNAWVNRRAVDFGAYVLCGLSGRPVPESVVEKVQQAEKQLQEIADGPRLIPFAPLRRRLAPVWSNVRVVPGYVFKCIRVEPQTSSPASPGYAQQPDWQAQFTFEI